MYRDKSFLAVIPARGGSVGVPRKNVRPLGGRPLLAWTIEVARQVPELDLVVVSTDDAEIAAVANGLGTRVIDRPAELATATARTEAALSHALDTLAPERSFDFVVTLEPTAPFRRPATVSQCIRAIVDRGASSALTVRETRASLGRLVEGYFRRLDPKAARRRQDRDPLYIETSTVYVTAVEHLRQTGSVVADDWLAVEIHEREAFDINTPSDFAMAEALLRTETP
jgi:CMP-N,N'-diacetyllegionaminic acid synthase